MLKHIRAQKVKLIILIFLILGLLLSYDLAAANEPDVRGAIKINDNAALFFVSFTLGSERGDMLVPLLSERTTSDELDTRSHYYIEDANEDVIEGGTTSALLLSENAAYEDGKYRIEKGKRASFTLLAVYTNEAGVGGHKLQMRTLPFEVENYLEDQQYNRHELGQFSSVSISLNEPN